MAIININNINYYYEETGLGEPLLLIAGLGCDVAVWTPVYAKFSQQFRVIMFDNRDVGRTNTLENDYSIDDMADDTVKLCQELGYTQVNILGHSMGGAIAQNIAYRYPKMVNKLIICNSLAQVPQLSKTTLEIIGRLRQVGADIGLSTQSLAPWIYSNDFLQRNNNLEKLAKLMQSYQFPQQIDSYLRQLRALCKFDSTMYLNKILHQTLIIAGSYDLLTPPSQSRLMAEHIPHSLLKILPGSHMQLIENPLLFVKTVKEFLDL